MQPSIAWIVRLDNPASSESLDEDQPSIARAPLICSAVSKRLDLFVAQIEQLRYKLCIKTIPSRDWRAEFQRLEGAYAPSTMRSYFADVEAFETWCLENGIVEIFPAHAETVCRFIEDEGKTKAPSTVRRRLYAIRKAHRLLQLEDPTREEDINLALRRVKRIKLVRPKQAKGLTRDYLERFIEIEPDTPWGLRNRAMLSLG